MPRGQFCGVRVAVSSGSKAGGSAGKSSRFEQYAVRLRALEERARNVCGCAVVGAYLRGQAVASAGLSCGWRDPATWGDLACRVCGGGGQLREVVRLFADGGDLLADFVRVVECCGCAGSGLDAGHAMDAGEAGAEALLASLQGRR